MKYFIKWARVPTTHNLTQINNVDGLVGCLTRVGIRLEFTTETKVNLGVDHHVIFKVWSETDTERHVYFENTGGPIPYMSPNIDALLGAELKEVRV